MLSLGKPLLVKMWEVFPFNIDLRVLTTFTFWLCILRNKLMYFLEHELLARFGAATSKANKVQNPCDKAKNYRPCEC